MLLRTEQFPKRIRNTIILAFTGTIAILLTLLGFSIDYLTKQHLEREMGKRLIAIARISADSLPTWLLSQLPNLEAGSKSTHWIHDKLLAITQTGHVRKAYLLNPELKLLMDSGQSMHYFERSLYDDELKLALQGHSGDTPLFQGQDGRHYKHALVPIHTDNRLVAILGVEASADFFADLTNMRRYLLYAMLGIALLIIIISLLISERLIHPIMHLVQAAKRIGMGDLTTPVTLPDRNELGLLSASIDEMRQELLEKEHRMKAMMQGIAHEIRNPLGGIELFAGLLQEEIPPKQDNLLHSVGKIKDEVQNLKKTVDQFLDFARDPILQMESSSLHEMIEDALHAIALAANAQGVKIRYENYEAALQMWVDKRLLKNALLNMLHNALQAIKHNSGLIVVQVSRKVMQDNDGIAIHIRDNGVGIAPEEIPHLFQPFYTTKEKGCGLGLAFSHKIIHSHSGTIEVDSALGKGTEMTIWLPLLLQP